MSRRCKTGSIRAGQCGMITGMCLIFSGSKGGAGQRIRLQESKPHQKIHASCEGWNLCTAPDAVPSVSARRHHSGCAKACRPQRLPVSAVRAQAASAQAGHPQAEAEAKKKEEASAATQPAAAAWRSAATWPAIASKPAADTRPKAASDR